MGNLFSKPKPKPEEVSKPSVTEPNFNHGNIVGSYSDTTILKDSYGKNNLRNHYTFNVSRKFLKSLFVNNSLGEVEECGFIVDYVN